MFDSRGSSTAMQHIAISTHGGLKKRKVLLLWLWSHGYVCAEYTVSVHEAVQCHYGEVRFLIMLKLAGTIWLALLPLVFSLPLCFGLTHSYCSTLFCTGNWTECIAIPARTESRAGQAAGDGAQCPQPKPSSSEAAVRGKQSESERTWGCHEGESKQNAR